MKGGAALPKRGSCSGPASCRSAVQLLLALGLGALFFAAGRLSRAPLPPPPPPAAAAAVAAASDPCTWPADFRPLALQEFLDVATMPYQHPLLPAAAAPIAVHVTKRPGASYGPHREFWETFSDGTWEPNTFRVMQAALRARPGGAHLDIGSWVGPTALFAAALGAKRVVALEPDPRAFNELLANVRLNPQLAGAVQAHRHCLSAASGPVTMTGPAPLGSSMSRVGGGVARIPAAAADEENWGQRSASWPAVCSSPGDFAARAGLRASELALVKLDAEGAEAALLPALVAWLAGALPPGAAKPPLFVELHTKMWGGGDARASAAAVARALATYRRAYAAREERPGHAIADNMLRPFDPLAQVAGDAEGRACPGGTEFCMVLAVDEAEEPAWVQGLLAAEQQ